ncbi:hypothetical protein MRB53_021803 [Persea americana]|uniref:Uncharacterized protein n=1 Tax=Persea americana TaxID=3435 RepID=A0ACC2L4Q7_PERAE|nr:hypothetical protein MRB53_021803 [Persea americana]
MSGSISDSMAAIPTLVHLDLSSNQFNGTLPKSLYEKKGLMYLNLENNNFQGAIPFNGSSIKMFVVFKVSGNNNLYYHRSIISSKLKIGIAPCDKDGFPILPPPDKSSSSSYDSLSRGGGNSDRSDDTGDGKDHG